MDSERPEVIHIAHLWAGYEDDDVLEDVNLSVRELDFLGIIGPNGGGKTTLLKVILGLLPPHRGEVKVLGLPPKQGRKFIGYVPQSVDFDRTFPISVRQVVLMGRLSKRPLLRRYTPQDYALVDELLERVGMDGLANAPMDSLSGGQRQRVYIARALATEPRILLLDEPTANIDPQMSSSIYELLRELNQQITIVMISHDIGAISSYVKTVGCLNRHLFYHQEDLLSPEMLERAYQCPIDLIAHGVPHRVFRTHSSTPSKELGGEL